MTKYCTLFFTICFLLYTTNTQAHTDQARFIANSTTTNVLDSFDVTKNEDGLFEVIGFIATHLIPDTAYGICMFTLKKPKVCNAVYRATEVLVALGDNNLRREVTEGIEWLVNRGEERSSINFKTKDKETAKAVSTVMKEYKRKNCVPWNNINESFSDSSNDIFLINFAEIPVRFSLSSDGNSNWKTYRLESGSYNEYFFTTPQGSSQPYGYIKIATTKNGVPLEQTYQINPNKRYNIQWNDAKDAWDVFYQ